MTLQQLQKSKNLKLSLSNRLNHYIEAEKISADIAIACSGGLDSQVLLDLFSENYPLENIYCIHLDHGIREDSHEAKSFLESYCMERNIKFFSKSFAYKEIGADENTARDKRYEFFESFAEKNKLKHIFLAHHANDQLETLLFRLGRGTSSSGLKGMPIKRELSSKEIYIHRPLLEASRKEIEDYAVLNKIPSIEDSSNHDLKYARNKIRHKISPVLLELNPKLLENTMALSHIISEEQDLINALALKELENLGPLPWDLLAFRQIHKALQRKVLEQTFSTNIAFCNDFLEAIQIGGFHRINYEKSKFFTIKQKKIHLEIK